jgi:hypothetical protein
MTISSIQHPASSIQHPADNYASDTNLIADTLIDRFKSDYDSFTYYNFSGAQGALERINSKLLKGDHSLSAKNASGSYSITKIGSDYFLDRSEPFGLIDPSLPKRFPLIKNQQSGTFQFKNP